VYKEDPERVKTVLYVATQIVANIAVLAQPFLPKTANRLFAMLQTEPQSWAQAGQQTLVEEGHVLGEQTLLFEKITDEQVDFQLQKLAEAKTKNAAAAAKAEPAKANISYDDFLKMDIRVGTILEAEKVAKTKKLLKLKIDTGIDQRIVV